MLASGLRLGPYEVIDPLGKGGMGEVYRARDTRLGRSVAIKVLPERTADSPDALARFEREARAVAALNHPNILALHDVGAASGVTYAVMELLEGETLRGRLRHGALPARKVLELAGQFAQGLAAAHARGLIHRDLKPENLFVTSDGRLKILDFGLVAHDAGAPGASTAETTYATESGLIIGTVGYMSPEQARGEQATVRSDVFAFGLVLYELLMGTNPFRRGTPAESMVAILRDQPESLSSVPGLPPVAARLIERCLEKEAENRPESMRDLGFALDAAMAAGNGRAPVVADRPGVPQRRVVTWGTAGASILLLLVTMAMWGYVGASGARTADDTIAADLARARGVVLRAQEARLDRLQLTARLVASFPELNALFETDAPTIRDFLQSYQQRNPGTPLLVALRPDGYVLARTDEAPGAVAVSGQEWQGALLAAGGAGVIAIDGRPFHAALSPAAAATTTFGYVLAAAPVDHSFAQALREATEDEAVLLDARGVAGSSLRAGDVPWPSLDAFRGAHGSSGSPADVTIGARRFSAGEVALSEEPAVAAVMLQSRDEITRPYRGMQAGLLAIGLAAILVVLAAGLAALRRLA